MKFELEPYNRNVTKEEILDDIRKVAVQLQKAAVTQKEYQKYGRYSPSVSRQRFGSWFTALSEAGLDKTRNLDIAADDCIDDLKAVAKHLGKNAITRAEYKENGKYSISPFLRHFGSWFNALERAGLEETRTWGVTDEEYFENIETLWIKLGRQPHYKDICKPFSKYCAGAYERHFGSWRKALEAFVEYINIDFEESPVSEKNVEYISEIEKEKDVFIHKTKREISDRLKVRVLIRDGNKCKLCGVTVTGDNIHFDHIKPWSKGGETVVENLQVLCAKHNLAKGDFYEEN